MKKVRIEHATDSQLNWLVAKIKEEYRPVPVPNYVGDWAQGGPLLEEAKITVTWDWNEWYAYSQGHCNVHWAETYLKAGVRVFVSIHLDDETEVPNE